MANLINGLSVNTGSSFFLGANYDLTVIYPIKLITVNCFNCLKKGGC